MFGVGLALVPLLLFMYLGLHSRLVLDDYVNIGVARDVGTWKAMLVWRDIWNGGYTKFLLYGILTPLDTSAPSVTPLLISASSVIGMGWLTNSILASLGIRAHRRVASVAIASLATAAAINGLYHPQVFYWFTAAVEYTWSVVLLLLGIALAVEAARRLGRVQLLLAALATALYAFMVAGFSETHLIFQLTALVLIACFVFLFSVGPKRKSYVILAMAGILGTVASLGVQLASPGFQNRSSQSNYEGIPIFPVRDLPELIERSLDALLEYMSPEASFAGFMLVVSAGMFLTLSLSSRDSLASRPPKIAAAYAPMAFALAVQLLFIPILWSHQSDNLQVLGRFSIAFMVVVCMHSCASLLLLALIWRRDLFEKALNSRIGLMTYCSFVLLLICLLFAMTQARSIHYKASSYLFVTALSMLIMLAGQLAFSAREPRLRDVFLLSAFATASAVLTLAAQIAVMWWGLGHIVERTMAPAPYTLMIAGLLNGIALGALIRHRCCRTHADAGWLRCIRLSCLLVAIAIATGIVIGQGQRISHTREDAAIWDAAHQEIIRLRDEGDPAVYTKLFPHFPNYRIGAIDSKYKNKPLDWMKMIYYGLLDGGESYHNCSCTNEMMALGDKAPFCVRVNCLAYGKSERG